VTLEQNLESAARPAVTEVGAADVERRPRDGVDVFGPRHERECRFGIDEAADRPRGGDAIHVQALASHEQQRLRRLHANARLVDRMAGRDAARRSEIVARDDRSVTVLERDHAAMRELTLRFRA
jgi:hypothetical protein